MSWFSAAVDGVMDTIYFRSPAGVGVLYWGILFATIGSLAVATVLRRQASASWLGRYAARIAPTYPYLLLQAGIAVVIGIEASIEIGFTRWLGWDFTPLVHNVEGNLVEGFQSALHGGPLGGFLDHVFLLSYTWGAMFLAFVPFLYLVFTGRVASVRRFAYTLALVWAVGILSYLFLPVYEVWVTNRPPYEYGHVENLLITRSPALETSAIYQTNLNNNFPSLHVASTSATAFALLYARERWLTWISAPLALLIAVATMYLGIHWFVDVIAGIATAWGAAWFVDREEQRLATRSAVPVETAAVRAEAE